MPTISNRTKNLQGWTFWELEGRSVIATNSQLRGENRWTFRSPAEAMKALQTVGDYSPYGKSAFKEFKCKLHEGME